MIMFYPDQILLYDDYIVNDMHTNGKGNKKLLILPLENLTTIKVISFFAFI